MSYLKNIPFKRRALMQLTVLGLVAGAAPGFQRTARAQNSIESTDASFSRLRNKQQLNIGIMIFPNMDQIDFTGPFEVLVRLPGTRIQVIGTEQGPFRDHKGMILTPEVTLADSPELDVLVVPGGPGQEALMTNEPVLAFIRNHVAAAKPLFSVCTGALICGAAGILQGRRATTHWAAFELLPLFGAIPVDERVVVDGNLVTAAGVTAGIDGALTVAALLRGDFAAQGIQLDIQYAPEPPFQSGTPQTAPAEVLAEVKGRFQSLTDTRRQTAAKFAKRFGIAAQ
jgi:cyclohexyl-isocyanide hydratase